MSAVVKAPTDLERVEASRRGLLLAAPGFLLVLLGAMPLGSDSGLLGAFALVARFSGWSLLALGLAMAAPTPNGPLPSWLKTLYVLAFCGAALRVVYHHWLFDPAKAAWEQRFVQLVQVAFLALPWILWRFCQHRGLNGRAITWLWCAMGLLIVFAVNWAVRASWALWLYPAVGVVFFVNARLTARDVWTDAIWKNARAAAAATDSAGT